MCWGKKIAEVKMLTTKVGPSKTVKDIQVGDIQMIQNFKYWFLGKIVHIEHVNSVAEMLQSHPFTAIVPFAEQESEVHTEFNSFYSQELSQSTGLSLLFYFVLEFKLGEEYPQSFVCGKCRVPRTVEHVLKKKDTIPNTNKCPCGIWICNDCLAMNKKSQCQQCMYYYCICTWIV